MGGTESRYELHVLCVKQSSEVILDLSLLQKQSIITTHKKSGLYMIKIIWVSEIFLGFICNCLSYFITAKITFTCTLHPQWTNMIFIIYTSCHSLHVMDISLSPNFKRGSDKEVRMHEVTRGAGVFSTIIPYRLPSSNVDASTSIAVIAEDLQYFWHILISQLGNLP